MNVVNSVLKAVKKGPDGFEDIAGFWTATDKLSFPLSTQVKSALFKGTAPSPKPVERVEGSDIEFNYDTSDTITDDDEDDYEEEESDEDGDDSDHGASPHGSTIASVSLRTDTSMRSPTKRQTPKSGASSTYSPLNQSLQSVGLSPLGTEGSYRSSIATASSRRSSGATAAHELHESGFDADESNEMNETALNGTKSGRSSLASASRRSSGIAESSVDATPATTTSSSRIRGDNSLNLSVPSISGVLSKSGSADLNRSARRVSFGHELGELSPIAGTASQPGTANSRRTSKSRSSYGTSMVTSAEKSGSVAQSEQYSPDDVDNERNDDFGADEYPPEEEDEDVSRMLSQTDTPEANKSASRSRLSMASGGSSALKTPFSEADSRRSSVSMSGSRRISLPTPGSHDFIRGTQLADETYIEEESGDMDTDDEVDTSAVITPAGRKRGGKRGGKDEIDEDADDVNASVMTDADSLLSGNKSFLHTIHSSNKKYVQGRKALHDIKPFVKAKGIKHKLYSSDEDNQDLQDTSEEDSEEDGAGLRRSRRATKGRRFAFWKGERPIYEEGTMVGLIPAEPTPAKKRRPGVGGMNRGRGGHASQQEGGDRSSRVGAATALPPVVVPKKNACVPRSECDILDMWDEEETVVTQMRVVCPAETLLPANELPITATRAPGKDLTATAAHAFNMPEVPGKYSGWLAGIMELLPQAIKDAEGVGKYMQIFFVAKCQDGGLELGIADPNESEYISRTAQRVLLHEGDCFHIPPGNIYRLENHSAAVTAKLHWTIIKPMEMVVEGEDDSVAESVTSPVTNSTVKPGAVNVRRYAAEADV